MPPMPVRRSSILPVASRASAFLDRERGRRRRPSRRSTKWIVIWFAPGSARGEAGRMKNRNKEREETSFARLLYVRPVSLKTLASPLPPPFHLPLSRLENGVSPIILISFASHRFSWYSLVIRRVACTVSCCLAENNEQESCKY